MSILISNVDCVLVDSQLALIILSRRKKILLTCNVAGNFEWETSTKPLLETSSGSVKMATKVVQLHRHVTRQKSSSGRPAQPQDNALPPARDPEDASGFAELRNQLSRKL